MYFSLSLVWDGVQLATQGALINYFTFRNDQIYSFVVSLSLTIFAALLALDKALYMKIFVN